MTDYNALKDLALAAQRTEDHYLSRSIAATNFANAASPGTVLGLIAENETLQKKYEELLSENRALLENLGDGL